MNITQLLADLATGELSDLSLGSETEGTVPADQIARVLRGVNSALSALHNRFICSWEEVPLTVTAERQRYPLRSVHAMTDTDVGNPEERFIQDTAEVPFPSRILRPLSASFGVVCDDGVYYLPTPFNEPNDPLSILTVREDILVIPEFYADKPFTVTYQPRPARVDTNTDPATEIDIPFALEQALLAKTASHVWGSRNGEMGIAKSQVLGNEYEMICAEIERQGLFEGPLGTANDKFVAGGWV